MSQDTTATRAIDVLRIPDVRRWILARLAAGTAASMLRAIVLWQVYQATHSAAYLGLVGLLQFLPSPVASLLGGAAADSRDRRHLVLAAQSLTLIVALVLAVGTHLERLPTAALFVLVVVVAIATAFEAPARQAMLPSLVPSEAFQRAVTVFATAQALAFMAGPALGGLVIAELGVSVASGVVVALYAGSMLLVLRVGARPIAGRRAVGLEGLLEGLRFLRSQPAILGAMSLDLFAVVFGGATALLPVFAEDVLRVGARGYGLLSASLEIGALATSLLLVVLPPIRRIGRAIVLSVVAYGLATIAFGLSTSFPLSVAAYVFVGMADQVSVVCRSTLVQLSTPDALRGRVSSVNMIFIVASNQLGAAEAGFVAALTSPRTAVVFGGSMVLVVVAIVVATLPSLLRYRSGGIAQGS